MFKKTLLLAIVLSIVIVMTLNHLAIAGTITGTVTKESDGTPIAGLWVDAQDYDTGEYRVGASTNSSGLYVISGLTGGTYRVKVSTWDTDFVEEYYDNVLDYDHATPVVVPAIGVVQNINFRLVLGGTITGIVTKESDGTPIAGLWVEACDYDTDQYRGGGETSSDGFYIISRLAACTYRIRVSTSGTDFIPEYYDNVLDYDDATPVVVPAAGLVQNINFSLEVGGLTVSGKVTDKATGSALADILVTYWNDDFEIWTYDYTDTDGTYKLTGLLPGWVQIRAEPESYYACIGTEFELTGDINNLDFALPAGAILSGKVIDADTAQPLAGIEVTYGNYRYAVWQNDFTDGDGTFTLTNLPLGIAEVKASPDVDSGYAWNLPWPADEIYLNEGEDKPNRIIALHKGALVSGYIKDPNGNPLSNFEYDYEGRLCEGWSETDINGQYKIRLPVGNYIICVDEDDFGALPKEVTITDVNLPVSVPDMIAYSEQSGGQISGFVNNPGGYPQTGNFMIVAFETGTVIDPNTLYPIRTISETDLEQAGPFTITKLPPGINYDVYLLVMSETPDEIESLALRDSALNVPVGTTGINLNYTSQGSTVTGKVTNTRGNPVLGATVLLTVSSTGNFAGFANVDANGDYIIYNVPAGTYTATAIHSKYLNTSETVHVANGVPANVSTIIMPFAGEKDGADLNGDGQVNMSDFAEFANQWLWSGSLEADFTKDNLVDFADLTRIAENWLWQAIWR